MAVKDCVDVGARLVDLGMDETLGVDRAAALVDRLALEVELHDVGLADTARRERGRHQETVLALGMAGADVAEPVDHALAVENAIGGYKVVDRGAEIRRRLRRHAAAKRRQRDQGEGSEGLPKAADGSAHRHSPSDRKAADRYDGHPEHT